MCHEVEAQAKNYYGCEPILKILSRTCSTGMKRVIFGTYEFLAPVLFWPVFSDILDQKMARSKKVVIIKNQFFHARQPREGIFEIYPY